MFIIDFYLTAWKGFLSVLHAMESMFSASMLRLMVAAQNMPRFVATGVGPEFLGRVRLGSSIASLVGVWIFQSFLKETKISKVLFWTAVAAVPLGFTQVRLP